MVLVCSSVAVLVAMACVEQPQATVPVPAPVVAYNGTPAASAKQEAILGAPSALQLLLAQQSGGVVAAPTPEPATVAPAAGGPTIPARQAIITTRSVSVPGYGWTPASPDRPDIFGSTAMPIARTQLDAKWRRANASASSAVTISRQIPAAAQAPSALEQIQLVNSWVNRRIQFVNDIRSTGQSDVWSGAAETLNRGKGDCEDYAITKMQLLKAMGYSTDDLYLAVVKDLVRRADHAVLVVRVDGHFVVLDNNVDRALDTREVADYRPLITYSASGQAWLHGYRQTTVQYASASAPVVPTTAN